MGEPKGNIDADEVMGHLVPLQIEPLGVKVLESSGYSDRVELTLTPLPPTEVLERFGTTPEELMDGFGITGEDMAAVYHFFEPAARAAGFTFTHELRGDQQVVTLSKS